MIHLSVQDLKKTFKASWPQKNTPVLKGISFQVKANSITGFLGANGAGKTTSLKCILGHIFPDSGEIKYFGRTEFDNLTKARIGFLPERPYFYQHLTGYEFLRFYGELSEKFTKNILHERILSMLKRVDLLHAKDRPLRNYSKGMLQKIGLSQALIHDPELVFLDEPMSGLDPDGRYYLSELIRETGRDGKAVFFTSHLLHDTEKLCDELVILKQGSVYYQGTTKKLLDSFKSPYVIDYVEKGQERTKAVHSLDDLQKEVSSIQKNGFTIRGIEQDKITLEEYFVKEVLASQRDA